MSKQEQINAGIYKTRSQLKSSLSDDIDELKELAAKLMAEKAILEEELELSKKLEGGIPDKLPPRLKSKIVTKLRSQLPLELLLEVVDLKPSSYYYSFIAARRPDKYAAIRPKIHEISNLSMHTYCSPRIWTALRRRGIYISEKVVRRLMNEEYIEVRYAKRKCKYTSYIGEITPAVPDLVQRNFHANKPNTLWLTDISEFAAKDDKIYLSPIIDCVRWLLIKPHAIQIIALLRQ